ncbi:transcriptional regulator [Pueribacillus theae]|uniref:Transcriptional regulator n=1 Tax=Pueribacillus theae TaxID=2171751 RepID=A0A2U1K5B0_9BACI|nr:helix-turn-helix transcriptional regulator [Pueribacillus theae]PWA12697.1 transcriptional regulator [Pueribacillus theae]
MGDLKKIIGERIRNFRKDKGLSQEELAHMSKLHSTYIGQLERGEKNATLESIEKVANALNISLETLFRISQPRQNENEYTLSQIVTQLQARSIKDQKFILELIDLLLDWKGK